MSNLEIDFEKFIDEFYSNMNQTKIVLQVDIINATKESNTNIYDIHCMLLDLFVAGITKFNLDFHQMNLEESICNLQYFFNNINIQLNIMSFTKQELILINSPYENRFVKFIKPTDFIINVQHKQLDNLEDIKSFYLINDDTNISISFEHAEIE